MIQNVQDGKASGNCSEFVKPDCVDLAERELSVQPAAFRATRKKAIADQLRHESYPYRDICQFKTQWEYRLPEGISSSRLSIGSPEFPLFDGGADRRAGTVRDGMPDGPSF